MSALKLEMLSKSERSLSHQQDTRKSLESTNGRLSSEWLEADADAAERSVKSIPTREVLTFL